MRKGGFAFHLAGFMQKGTRKQANGAIRWHF